MKLNFGAAELVSIDIETKDPDLKTKGAGVRRGAHIAGIAIGCKYPDGSIASEYLSMRHPDSENVPRGTMERVLRDIERTGTPITGANLLYDLDFIAEDFGVNFSNNPWEDVQVAEPLIDENAKSYSLDSLGLKYVGQGKHSADMETWLQAHFKGKPAENIWRAPAFVVAPYACRDAELPLLIHGKQRAIIEAENLGDVFDLECRLQPMLLAMKRKGVRVDLDATQAMTLEFEVKFQEAMNTLKAMNGGVFVEVWSASSIADAFDRKGWGYPLTPTGKPSFTKEFLSGHKMLFAKLVLEARQYDKMRSTFLENALLRQVVGDRIHCQFNQLRGDEYGTVTGRMSSSNPNLQQIPRRSAIGKRLRTLFIPDDGEQWYKLDYSQIEPRLLLSYASGHAANSVVAAYRANPALDCYNSMMTNMPSSLNRDAVKAIFLGATYGMGKELMASTMGVSVEEAEPQFEAFHKGAPYIKLLANACSAQAEARGMIRTIGGRLSRFNLYEPRKFTRGATALPYDEAVAAYGQVRRAFGYKALNRLVQGSAADVMKLSMVEGYEAGLPIPMLTIHDEIDHSSPCRGDMIRWKEVMESVYRDKLKVPMRVDMEEGDSWGNVK